MVVCLPRDPADDVVVVVVVAAVVAVAVEAAVAAVAAVVVVTVVAVVWSVSPCMHGVSFASLGGCGCVSVLSPSGYTLTQAPMCALRCDAGDGGGAGDGGD